MKALKVIGIILASLAVIFVGGLAYIGFFSKIEIKEEKNFGGHLIAGIKVTGPYINVGKSLRTVDSIMRSNKIYCPRGFGMYYDDPKFTPQEKCRSFVGSIIEIPDSALLFKLDSLGLTIERMPKSAASVVEFEIKNNLSFMVGAIRVYPKISKYIEDKGLAPTLCVEIYDMSQKKIYYAMQHI